VQHALAGLHVGDVMRRDPVVVSSDLTVCELMDATAHGRRYATYPVVEDGSPVGLLPLSAFARIPRHVWEERHVREYMLPLTEVPVLDEDASAVDALAAVGGSDAQHALVVRGGRLVGLLSLSDFTRVLDATPRGRRPLAA
jgi:CBS domain-containing protein